MRKLTLLWLLLLPRLCPAQPKTMVFTGGLVSVLPQALTIQRADGVLIDARVSDRGSQTSAVLKSRYQLGDQVEITCRAIARFWDSDAHLYRTIQLVKLKFLRSPKPDEMAKAVASRAWREPGNLLLPKSPPPTANAAQHTVDAPDDARRFLQAARAVNLKFAASLPNFVADETAARSTSSAVPPQWKPLDTIQSVATFKGANDDRDHVTQNGKPVLSIMAVRGLHWDGAFGPRLKAVFDPDCPVTFKFVNRVSQNGANLLEFEFTAPPDSCFPATVSDNERFYPARAGKVYLDAATGNTIQYEEGAGGFPAKFAIVETERRAVWNYLKIGDAPHLLPVAGDEIVQFHGRLEWVKLKYANHRNFAAAPTGTPQ